MPDLSEFKQHWRSLLACFIGLGSALSINSSLLSIMAPYYLKEFSWSRETWISIQSASVVILFFLPFVGRMADRFGVMRVAPIGMIIFPLSLFAVTMLSPSPDSVRNYTIIFVLQTILACTTTATVYTRLVANSFVKSRGLALGLCALSPAIFGLIAPSIITQYVADHGWRNGLYAIAIFSMIASVITITLLYGQQKDQDNSAPKAMSEAGVWKSIMTRPVFWVIFAATFFVSLPHPIVLSSQKLLAMEQGMSDLQAAQLMSIFSAAVIIGRILSGIALDTFRPHTVAALFLGLPVLGLLLFAGPLDGFAWLAVAVALIGLAFGGEADVVGYLIVRHFGIGLYSTVMGLTTGAIGLASSGGSAAMGQLVKATGNFNAYLILAAIGVFIGAVLFKFLERFPQDAPAGDRDLA